MPGEVDICNLALSRLGHSIYITSLDTTADTSAEAEACAKQYPIARDFALASWPWSFAKQYAALALTTNTVPRIWTYEYAEPADCRRVIRIEPQRRSLPKVPYERGVAGGARVIWTDEPEALLKYVSDLTDPNVFSSEFNTALAWLVASYLAGNFAVSSRTARADCWQMYRNEIAVAQAEDANAESNSERTEPAALTARL